MKSLLALIVLVLTATLTAGRAQEALDGVITIVNDSVIRLPEKTPYDAVPASRDEYRSAYRRGYLQAMEGSSVDPQAPADKPVHEAISAGFRAGQKSADSNGHKGRAKIKTSDRAKVHPKFANGPSDNSKELSFDWGLVPQRAEFEGFINDGDTIQSVATIVTPNVINESAFSTRKVMTSVSVFDGTSVVLGGLIREDVPKVEDKADDRSADALQKLIKERDQLKQRLLEVDALIKKHVKE